MRGREPGQGVWSGLRTLLVSTFRMLTLAGGPTGAGGAAGVGGCAGAAGGAGWNGAGDAPCAPGVCAAAGMNADGCGTCAAALPPSGWPPCCRPWEHSPLAPTTALDTACYLSVSVQENCGLMPDVVAADQGHVR